MSKKLILPWVSNKLKHWGVEGPRPLPGDPLSSIPSPRPISPGAGARTHLWSTRQSRGTSGRVWQPRGPKLHGPRVSSKHGRVPSLTLGWPLWSARPGSPRSGAGPVLGHLPSRLPAFTVSLPLPSFSPISPPFFTRAGAEDLGAATARGATARSRLFLGLCPPRKDQQPLQGTGVGFTT